MPDLSGVERFIQGKSHKYTAILKDGKHVSFGAKGYQHYHDSVPKSMGGGKYSHLDHGDTKRRANYRRRHAAITLKSGAAAYKVKYSPAWFSYYLLW